MNAQKSLGILLTRAQSQSERTAKKIEKLDPEWLPFVAPLFRVISMPWAVPKTTPQAIIITSVNAVFALASLPFKVPVHVVGSATAEAVTEAGFDVSTVARHAEDLTSLLIAELDPQRGPLLYLSGTEITADFETLLAPHHLQVQRVIVYRTETQDQLPTDILEKIDEGTISCALVYSRKSLAALVAALPVRSRAKMTILCLSEAICDDADVGFRRILCAAHPSEASLLDLLEDVVPKPQPKPKKREK